MEGVVVTRPYGVGNAVQALPALKMLKRAGVKFRVWVEHPHTLNLYDGIFETVGRIKGDSDFSCSTWISLYPWDSALKVENCERKFGYHAEDEPELKKKMDLWSVNEAKFNTEIVAMYLGLKVWALPSCLMREGDGLYRPIEKLVGLHPGCQPGPWLVKRWPRHKWADLAKRLLDAGRKVRIFGLTAEEGDVIDGLRSDFGDVVEWVVDVPVLEAVAKAGECSAFASNDSGMAHLAVAGGCGNVIVLYGPTRPEKNLHDGMRAVRALGSCLHMPCYSDHFARDCSANVCMNAISVADVMRALA